MRDYDGDMKPFQDALAKKAKKEKRAGVIERMNQRYETAMRFMKRRK